MANRPSKAPATDLAADQTGRRATLPQQPSDLTTAERAAKGKAARQALPRGDHATWKPPRDRPDPIGLLAAQASTRIPELLPIRYQRMLVSPFAFYRGAAAIMACDLAATPSSGLWVQLCGDAHLANFGGFASPERALVFDINDFDETLPGPWEWDVKRLAASCEVAGRERGLTSKQCRPIVLAAIGEYRRAMRQFSAMGTLDVWHALLDRARIAELGDVTVSSIAAKEIKLMTAAAHTRDNVRALEKLTRVVDGQFRIVSNPPLVVAIEDLATDAERERVEKNMGRWIDTYRQSLPHDRRRLLEGYHYVHMARKVVGVGSVGMRAWIVLLFGRDDGDPLFLQIKEAQGSVLEPYLGTSAYATSGQRVIEGQRMMQATSDILLGWERMQGIDGQTRDFYVRQLWDWKVSADVATMSLKALAAYGEMCAWTLARAHARSGDRIAIAAYLGTSDTFDHAVATFAAAYADQNERDYQALAGAVKSGRVEASGNA